VLSASNQEPSANSAELHPQTLEITHPANPYLLVDQGIEDVRLETPSLIIPRQCLFYQYLDLTLVPRPLRQSFIEQRLRQLSPFPHAAHWLVMSGDHAQLWFWDADKVKQQIEAAELSHLAIVPEPLLRAPVAQGFNLQACITGWELQYWVDGSLRNSRWLALAPGAMPDNNSCADFVRAAGANLGDLGWQQHESPLLPRPWNEKPFWSKENLTSEPVATRLIAGLLFAWLFLALGLSLGTQIKESLLASQVEQKSSELLDIVNQRDAAMRQQEFNQAIGALVQSPTPLQLVAEVQDCLAFFEFVILDWQYQRGQLSLLIQQQSETALDTRGLIEACSASVLFTDVRAEPGITPDQTRLLFSLPNAESALVAGAEND